MTAPTTSPLAFPGLDLADPLLNGGWVKRASVSPSRLPRVGGEQRQCPSNGHLPRPYPNRGLSCTFHQPGWHAAVSLGHVLAAWPERAAAARVATVRADEGGA